MSQPTGPTLGWGQTKTDAGYDKYADVNGDGYTNVGDLQLLVRNWGK